jgi:hypothetical protein
MITLPDSSTRRSTDGSARPSSRRLQVLGTGLIMTLAAAVELWSLARARRRLRRLDRSLA